MNDYNRNKPFSKKERERLRSSYVTVVGCGGLGCYVLEMLVRLGIGQIKAIDGDDFDTSNLNRQLLSNIFTIGEAKVYEAKKRAISINPQVTFLAVKDYFKKINAKTLLQGSHLVIDCLDNVEDRLLLEKTCSSLGIPLIHGAVNGWSGHVAVIYPNDNILETLLQPSSFKWTPAYSPGLVASVQVAEAVKVLLDKGAKTQELIYIDLLHNHFQKVKL
ncbi:HesA/MoeB/ThiF family protein [Acidaminobacter sp. JC074]|uniref:HesA/MoeB/ThiF family protein n=1 Tax=Acidaminobacter sp. JC074 TaxID=2530199 RepID=UPI001F0F95EA|nr:HesA/MoeB/ThiF family protein [Acidaminobacter sp. JC074]MCH4886460.1 HesA/MoeB/ThiF family protein [Acidaminobacter sp. JC074]